MQFTVGILVFCCPHQCVGGFHDQASVDRMIAQAQGAGCVEPGNCRAWHQKRSNTQPGAARMVQDKGGVCVEHPHFAGVQRNRGAPLCDRADAVQLQVHIDPGFRRCGDLGARSMNIVRPCAHRIQSPDGHRPRAHHRPKPSSRCMRQFRLQRHKAGANPVATVIKGICRRYIPRVPDARWVGVMGQGCGRLGHGVETFAQGRFLTTIV